LKIRDSKFKVQQINNSTNQQLNNSTTQQINNSTNQQFNNSTTQQINKSTTQLNTPNHCPPNITRKNTCLNFFLCFGLFFDC